MFLNLEMKNLLIGRILACFIFLFLILPNLVLADNYNIYNLTFSGFEYFEVDSKQVQVDFENKSEIINLIDFESYITKRVFKTNQEFSREDLSIFFNSAIKDSNLELSCLAFEKISTKEFDADVFLELKKNFTKEFLSLFNEKYFVNLDSKTIKDSLFWQSYIHASVANGFNSNFIWSHRNSVLLNDIAKEQVLKLMHNASSKAKVHDVIDSFSVILAKNSLFEELKTFIDQYYVLTSSASKFNSGYKKLLINFPELSLQFKKVIDGKRDLFFNESIENKYLQIAFDNILLTDFNERTEKTHENLISLIELIDINHSILLILNPYQETLRNYSTKDKRIYESVVKLYEKVINNLLKDDNPGEITDYLLALKAIRPESIKNTDLLFSQIKFFHSLGYKDVALEMYNNTTSSFSLLQKVWFFFHGFYFKTLILIALLIIIYFVKRYVLNSEGVRSSMGAIKEEVEEVIESGSLFSRVNSLNPKMQKYNAQLKFFSLEAGCTLKDIKSAYRKKIKTYHPDLNPNQHSESQDEFISITKKYENLVKVHEELFPSDSND